MGDRPAGESGGQAERVRVFIQARMSSSRLPGKVLAPFRGRPIIAHVVERVARAVPLERIILVTSSEPADDPLAGYVGELGARVFRGPLDNVFERFRLCLEAYPCDWFVRICADSPLLNSKLIGRVLGYAERADIDLVTNVQVRTFPRGHSVEMVKATTFEGINAAGLSAEEREHVTKVYYHHPERFKIVNLESGNPALAELSYVVDTLEDLRRLEQEAADEEANT